MDVTLQRHCAKYIYVIPEGLRELMSDISREVLRSQPEDIYTFIADYIDALIITRENAKVAARLVQIIEETSLAIVKFMKRTDITREEADRIAIIIQRAFRKYLESKPRLEEEEEEKNVIEEIIRDANLSEKQAEKAAIVIQRAFRAFKRRRDEQKELGEVDWRSAARSTIALYRKTGVTLEEANRAATLIKAAYKGYYTRKVRQKLLEAFKREDSSKSSTESTESLAYFEKEGKVRIDFSSVISHVDFDDVAMLAEDYQTRQNVMLVKSILEDILKTICGPSLVEEELELSVNELDSKAEITEIVEKKESVEMFIRNMILDQLLSCKFDEKSVLETEMPIDSEEIFVEEDVVLEGALAESTKVDVMDEEQPFEENEE